MCSKPRAHGPFAMTATAMTMSEALPCHASPPSQETMYRALADLDPATAKVAGPARSAFGFLFILRIVIMSWYPKLHARDLVPYVMAYAPTEAPFLAFTRKVVTPVVWFGLVGFLNEMLVALLVLLSQQA